MSLVHLIYGSTGALTAEVPFVSTDPDTGLPAWFFEGEFVNFEVDREADKVEWIPAMGPAPCWKAKFSEVAGDLFNEWNRWAKEVYG